MYLLAEFMHQVRPKDERRRAVFDFCLHSRLSQLTQDDQVLFICRNQATVDSFAPFAQATAAQVDFAFANPPIASYLANTPQSETPYALAWDQPTRWMRYAMTDRWSRIMYALQYADQLHNSGVNGYLLMPAHDAVFGDGLLNRLRCLSEKFAAQGIPAAVSPYTYFQHSPVPNLEIDPHMIDLLNTALGRDPLFWWRLTRDQVQGFWGKMSMTPFAMCGALLSEVDTTTLEDDLIIDTALRRLGYGVRAVWAWDARQYRQALPVFDRADVRAVIMRTLHYSLNVRGSTLNQPLNWAGRLNALVNPKFRLLNTQAENLIAECGAEIEGRLAQYNASWVDWGAYRYVVRLSHPSVEVWKHNNLML